MGKDKDKASGGGGAPSTSTAQGAAPNAAYTRWLLEAIRKIKHQKQRPCLERIALAMKHMRGELNLETVKTQLEMAVQAGDIECVCNKGVNSYRDPLRGASISSTPTGMLLRLNRKSDLTRVIIKSIKELGHKDGSSLKNIEKFIRRKYEIKLEDNLDLYHQLRRSAKKAVNSKRLLNEGRFYMVPAGTAVDTTPPKPEPEEETIVDMAAKNVKNKVGMISLRTASLVLKSGALQRLMM